MSPLYSTPDAAGGPTSVANPPPWPTPGSFANHRVPDIVAYLGEFDLDLADVVPEQLAMFLAARHAADFVEPLEAHVASKSEPFRRSSLVERETEELLERTAHDSVYRDGRLPADEMDVGAIGGPQDLSRLFPTQWLMEEVQPALFYRKLAQRELIMPVWQSPTSGWRDSYDDIPRRDIVDARAVPTTTRQHAYVLLDVSRTMNDRDRRGTVARGFALAFLRHGYRTRCRLNFRPFTHEVGDLSSGSGGTALRDLARRVIALPNAGQTRIQTALERAVDDVRRAGPCRRADIMLISDGISRLTTNPLGEETLHTFILGEMGDAETESGAVATLREWSQSFHRIRDRQFTELLAPGRADVDAAMEVLQTALHCRETDPSAVTTAALRRLRDNAAFLLDQWKRTSAERESRPAEVAAWEDRLAAAERTLPPNAAAPPGKQAARSQPRWGAVNAAERLGYAWAGKRDGHLWTLIRRLAVAARQWAATTRRRLWNRSPLP